jgi:hypothetical protein
VANLVRQSFSYYIDANGKRVPKGTKGATRRAEKSTKWYGQGIPGYPPKKRVPLATNKTAAQRMLDDLVRAAEKGNARLPDRRAGEKSIKDHLERFQDDLVHGVGGKGGKKRKVPSEEQVKLVVQRVRDVFAGQNWSTPEISTRKPLARCRSIFEVVWENLGRRTGYLLSQPRSCLPRPDVLPGGLQTRAHPSDQICLTGLPGSIPQTTGDIPDGKSLLMNLPS